MSEYENEIAQIAAHTARRGSGCVGRSAAGRQLDQGALRLAVIAHIRHTHTPYDDLLMTGCPRRLARQKIAPQIDRRIAPSSPVASPTRSPWAPIERASWSQAISPRSALIVSSGPRDFLIRVLMGLSANCWFIFTMPHWRSASTR